MSAAVNRLPPAHWFRGLEASETEHDRLPIERIEGRLPPYLRGTYFINGPGQNEVFGRRNGHWFDGDGMIRAFRFDGRSVTFSNRFVRTHAFVRESEEKRSLYPGIGTIAPGGIARNLFRKPKNPANTHTLLHAGRLLALWEGGRPYALNPETLETLGEEDFSGTLPDATMFSAHPHRDPRTGALYNAGPVVGGKHAVQPWRVSPMGTAAPLPRIVTDKMHMLHDFGLTETRLIIMGAPLTLDPRKIPRYLLARRSLIECTRFDPTEPMSVYVIQREGSNQVRRYELPAAIFFHISNAFDDGDDFVVDACLYPDDGVLRVIADVFAGNIPRDDPGYLTRIRFRPDGTSTQERLSDTYMDFPRIDPRRETLSYTFAYTLVFERGQLASSKIARVNTRTRTTVVHDFGAGCTPGEPVFVPRPGSTGEDDGWVLTLVYDSADHHSFLGIVPADQFGKEEVRVHLPFHSPIPFHGSFVPA